MRNLLPKIWGWTKDKARRFWKWSVAVVVGVAALASTTLLPSDAKTVDAIIEKIADGQVLVDGKYRQHFSVESIDGIDITSAELSDIKVHEYVSSKGPGYQIFLYREAVVNTASGSHQTKQIKSVGYGPEADSRTWNWK